MKRVVEAVAASVVIAVVVVAIAAAVLMTVSKVITPKEVDGESAGAQTSSFAQSVDEAFSSLRVWVDKITGKSTENKSQSIERTKGEAGKEPSKQLTTEQAKNNKNRIYPVGHRVADLPLIMAKGNVPGTRVVMLDSPTYELQDLLIKFVEEKDAKARDTLLNPIIFAWTGADKYANNSRGAYIDGRIVYALEALFAEEFLQNGLYRNPSSGAADKLKESYQDIRNYVNATLLGESHLQPYMLLIRNDLKEKQLVNAGSKTPEFNNLIKELKLNYAQDKNQTIQLVKNIRYVIWNGHSYKESRNSTLQKLRKAVDSISDQGMIEFKADISAALSNA